MSRATVRTLTRLLCAGLASAGLAACGGSASAAAGRDAPGESAVVRRGTFQGRLLLTGELEAEAGVDLAVPRTPSWRVQIRRMVEDGAEVAAGETVVELDNSSFVSDLEEKKLQATESTHQLTRRRAELAAQEAEKLFRVEQKQTELDKATIDAAVPVELVSRREYEEKQLAKEKAQVELAKAREELEAQRAAAAAELAQQELELDRKRREIAVAEEAIDRLVVTAPRAGTVILADHPWEGRKLQEGDSVWVGLVLARLPDPGALVVRASLSDVDDGRLAVGMPVTCTPDAYPDAPFPGRVTEISPIAREEPGESLRRFFAVRVEPGEGLAGRGLVPGMSVKVEAPTGSRQEVLLAPRRALDLSADPPRARLADGGEKAVELGPCNSQECVVEGGLAEGERLAATAGGDQESGG